MVAKYGSINHNVEEKDDDSFYNEENVSENGTRRATLFNYNYVLGVALSIISGILFTANNFIINQFQVVVSDAVIVRCIIQISIYTIIICSSSDRFLPHDCKKKLFTLSQGLAGAINFITSLASVTFMPVPDALCIIFTCPVVTILLSIIILGDKLNVIKCVAGVLLLLGVVLVCQPPLLFNHLLADTLLTLHDNLYYAGVALAVTACVTGGLKNVLVAKCEGVSTSSLVNWSAIFGLVIAVTYSQFQSDSRILSVAITEISWSDWFILIGLAVSGLLAFTSGTKALQLISPNLVASLRAMELVLAYGVQSLITWESPDTLSCIGGGLVLGGVLLLTFQDPIFHVVRLCQSYRHTGLDEYSRLSGE